MFLIWVDNIHGIKPLFLHLNTLFNILEAPFKQLLNFDVLSKNRVNFHSIFTPWVVTSVITTFAVNIE